MFSIRRYASIFALVTLFSPSSSASPVAQTIEDRSTNNATSNLLGFDPSSCRGISGRNPWALGLTSEATDDLSDFTANDHTSQLNSSLNKRDGSTILQLNPLAPDNVTAPGFGNQCETLALLDFNARPQDGGTIRTPALTFTPSPVYGYLLSTGLNNGAPQVTLWNRASGVLTWTRLSTRLVKPHSTFRVAVDFAGQHAFDYSLVPSTQPTTGSIAVFRIRLG